jgi:predicted DNA-binding transcriptional regulator AlpA
MDWSVLVESRAPEPVDIDIADQLGDLQDSLGAHFAAVGGDGRGWDVRLSVTTGDDIDAAVRAVEEGSRLVLTYAEKVGLPLWPVIRTEAVEEDTFHNELEVSTFPAMLGTTEVTELLGVSRQRLHELRNSGRFPAPAYELAATPLWIRSTVDSFVAGWSRKPGRPAKVMHHAVPVHKEDGSWTAVCDAEGGEFAIGKPLTSIEQAQQLADSHNRIYQD